MKAPGTRPAGKTMINFINRILTKIFGSTGDRAEKELKADRFAAERKDAAERKARDRPRKYPQNPPNESCGKYRFTYVEFLKETRFR